MEAGDPIVVYTGPLRLAPGGADLVLPLVAALQPVPRVLDVGPALADTLAIGHAPVRLVRPALLLSKYPDAARTVFAGLPAEAALTPHAPLGPAAPGVGDFYDEDEEPSLLGQAAPERDERTMRAWMTTNAWLAAANGAPPAEVQEACNALLAAAKAAPRPLADDYRAQVALCVRRRRFGL